MRIPDHWGAGERDAAGPWPCDALAAPEALAWLRAVDVDASPRTVFRWLCQLRAAPYSYDWIDNRGRRSPRTWTPGLDELEVGQRVMSIFRLVSFERDVHLTLRVESGIFGELIVTYRVSPADGASHAATRLAARLRVPAPTSLVGHVATRALAWGDLVMMRKQLLTLKRLAERGPAAG